MMLYKLNNSNMNNNKKNQIFQDSFYIGGPRDKLSPMWAYHATGCWPSQQAPLNALAKILNK